VLNWCPPFEGTVTANPDGSGEGWGPQVLKEFKEFINKGNLIELATAFIMGLAFKSVVDAFVGNGTPELPGIVGSLIAIVFGGDAAAGLAGKGPVVNGTLIPIGSFVAALINFLIIAFVMFMIVKAYNKMKKNSPPDEPSDEVKLLAEIRDQLRAPR
jgi:large conductance mechanosensitive channel